MYSQYISSCACLSLSICPNMVVCTCISFIEQDKSTALHLASINGHDKVVRVLLAVKATVNTRNKVSSVQVCNRSVTVYLIMLLSFVCIVGRVSSLLSKF